MPLLREDLKMEKLVFTKTMIISKSLVILFNLISNKKEEMMTMQKI
jgi:hypothetical protein